MESNVRIPVNLNSDEQQVTFKLEQDFNSLDILSLTLNDSDIYNRECSDFGVIVGRVNLNEGFGVANARVSVFIPINENDKDRPEIIKHYPFENIDDTYPNGVRYNLLPRLKQPNPSHKSVGTFPDITDLTHYPTYLEIFEKYYKFTTTTNFAGDFMIYGVPLGLQNVHMDFDLFDTPSFTLTANDLVSNVAFFENVSGDILLKEEEGGGIDPNMIPKYIYNGDGEYEVKVNTDIDSMPNIFSETKQINVVPFWGDEGTCNVGITRVDFNIDYDLKPNAIFFGSFLSMDSKYYITNDYKNSIFFDESKPNIDDDIFPTKNLKLVVYSKDQESLKAGSIERLGVFNQIKDGSGVFRVSLPMYEDYYRTNEYGQIIPSTDGRGIPTAGTYAFELFEADEKNYGRRGDLEEGYNKYLQPGVRIPSKDDGNPYAGGWTGTWSSSSIFRYDIQNSKQKFYTIKTDYRKHIPGDIGIGGIGSVIQYLPREKQGYNYNFPIIVDNLTDDTSVIGSFLVPRIEFKERRVRAWSPELYDFYQRLDLQSPDKIVSLPFLNAPSGTNGIDIKKHERVLGIGVGENGSNKAGIWYDLFDVNAVNNIREVEGYNFGDNDRSGEFSPHAYATILNTDEDSLAFGTEEDTLEAYTVHPHYNFAHSDTETLLLVTSAVEGQFNQKLCSVDIVDITDDLNKLIENNVFTSYGLTDNKFNGKHYFFGKDKETNALWWIKEQYYG